MATESVNHKDREHALLSASSAHRWLACPPSAVASELYEATDTEFTREGTFAHEVAEAMAKNNRLRFDALLKSPEITGEMIDCAESYRDYIEEQVKTTTPILLLEQRVDFSPWVPDGFGTCDCIIIQDDTLILIDYKFGAGVQVSAIDNPQLRLYALGALNDYGFVYDVQKVETHIFQPRLNHISVDRFNVEELMTWADKTVKPIAKKAAKGKGDYCAGVHCKFCPHAGKCKTLTKTCTEYVETHNLRVGVPVLAPHEVAEVLQMEGLINLWLKRVKAQAMSTIMDGGDIPGFKVVEGRSSRAWADDMRVVEILKDSGFTTEDYLKTELLSPAGMEGSIGKKKTAELLGGMIIKKPGAPTIAPESDRREPINRLAEAQKDFE